jgi:Protein of unknown function (DUF4242)
MATATRGAAARREALPCEFEFEFEFVFFDSFVVFIGFNISCPRRDGYFLRLRLEFISGASEVCSHASRRHRKEDMPKYVIERDIPNVGSVTPDQVIAISQKSCSVLNNLGPQIQWLHSYVTQDRIYCVYIAPNEEMVREHARQGGFPANRVSEVKLVIDPTSAEV